MMSRREPTFESICADKRRVIAKLEQMLRDANYWNGLPQAVGCPLDMEPERLAIYYAKRSLELFERFEFEASMTEWDHVVQIMKESL